MAFRLPELLIQTVLWVFSRVAFPVYSKSRALGAQALKHAAHRALTFTSLFGFPVAAGLALLSRDVVLTLLSSKWQPAIADDADRDRSRARLSRVQLRRPFS